MTADRSRQMTVARYRPTNLSPLQGLFLQVVVACLLQYSTATEENGFSKSVVLNKRVGEFAMFHCQPNPPEEVTKVQWTKDGEIVFGWFGELPTIDERYDGRLIVVESTKYTGSSVNVTNLRESDTGLYECNLVLPIKGEILSFVNHTEEFSNNSRFQLYVEGGDIMSIPPINQTRMEHDSVHFTCVKEDPESIVQWYKDGIPLADLPYLKSRFHIAPEGSLDIYDAQLKDNGLYSCRIASGKGTLLAGAYLNVQYKAKIVYAPAKVFLAYSKPGNLDCHFHSNPPLTKIRWEKDGFLFDTYNVHGVYHELNGSLYFNSVGEEHEGTYTCTPFNDLGTEGPSTPMEVIVQRPPKFVIVPKVLYFRKVGDNVTMPCAAENLHRDPAIVWQKENGKSLFNPRVSLHGGNLTLIDLRYEDRGIYRCVASNIAATISVETELIVEESLMRHKQFDLLVNSTDKNMVAYWKQPYSDCTVWSRELNSPNWIIAATSNDGKAILSRLNISKEYEIMVSCQNDNRESLFSKSTVIRPTGPEDWMPQIYKTEITKDPFTVWVNRIQGDNDSYNISWTTPSVDNLQVKHYDIKWYDANDSQEIGSATTKNNRHYIVVNLADGMVYNIHVLATMVNGQRLSSEKLIYRTSAAAKASMRSNTVKYYYIVLLILFFVGVVFLWCNSCHDKR
ncbi:protein borderless isoform X2 [Adelges cooleyi]|uniref:protein borderless isoform X2 n=1 Tax=Adelges cooleyi TaxID=133065 RepID=UPI00217F3C3E|nr:protein borderless isoform X2 [Adelges cooleyi]